jgi:preprotein translocase subunit SecG
VLLLTLGLLLLLLLLQDKEGGGEGADESKFDEFMGSDAGEQQGNVNM